MQISRQLQIEANSTEEFVYEQQRPQDEPRINRSFNEETISERHITPRFMINSEVITITR